MKIYYTDFFYFDFLLSSLQLNLCAHSDETVAGLLSPCFYTLCWSTGRWTRQKVEQKRSNSQFYTLTRRCRRHQKYSSFSAMKKSKNISLTQVSTWQVGCCQANCSFSFQFEASTSSTFYHSHCLYRRLLTKLKLAYPLNHWMKLNAFFHYF